MADHTPAERQMPTARLFVAGAVGLGIGLGGLLDGILLHQVLQWHHLASAQIDPGTTGGLRRNLFWDGAFHATTTAMVAVGLLVLWRAWEHRRHATGNTAALVGLTLVGWGVFHAIDQLLFHLALGLHNIREDAADPAPYNWGFFAIGLVLAAAGWLLYRVRGRLGASSLQLPSGAKQR